MACAPQLQQSFQSLLLPHKVGTGINPDRPTDLVLLQKGSLGVLVAEGMGQGWGSFAMGDGFGHIPIYKVFCHILGPEQMDCGTEVHLLRMDELWEVKHCQRFLSATGAAM